MKCPYLLIRAFGKLLFKNNQILTAEADYRMHLAPQGLELLCNGQSDCAAHAAADDADLFHSVGFSCTAQRTFPLQYIKRIRKVISE